MESHYLNEEVESENHHALIIVKRWYTVIVWQQFGFNF